MTWLWGALFFIASFFNLRAVFKLLIDWKGMHTTCRFVADAYAQLDALSDEAALERERGAPVFVHLVAAYQEPDIEPTLRALLNSRYPHGKLHVIVVTKDEEDRAPHPMMAAPTPSSRRSSARATTPPGSSRSSPAIAFSSP